MLAVLGNLLLLSSLLLFLVSFIKLIRSPQEECALLYFLEPPRNLLHVQISGPASDLLTQKLGVGGRSLCSTFSQVLQVVLGSLVQEPLIQYKNALWRARKEHLLLTLFCVEQWEGLMVEG